MPPPSPVIPQAPQAKPNSVLWGVGGPDSGLQGPGLGAKPCRPLAAVRPPICVAQAQPPGWGCLVLHQEP